MKLNGVDNIITDKDIIVTSNVGSNKPLSAIIEKQQENIDELKSNVKWIYKYGGVGSGSGGGGNGTAGKWKASITVNKRNVNNNDKIDLSNEVVNGSVTTQVTVAISNPGAGGYRFILYYAYDGNDYQQYSTALTPDNMFNAVFTIRLTQNDKLSIKIVDIENVINVYDISYFIYGYTCNIQPLVIKDNKEQFVTDNSFKPGLYRNGIIFRVTLKNYAGFSINYNTLNTMPYRIYKINKEDPEKYFGTITDQQSYYLKDENKGFIHKETTEVILDYILEYEDLSNELNFGNHLFTIKLNILSTSGDETQTQYTYEYTDTPDSDTYIICLTDTVAGTVYDTKDESISIEELEKNAFYTGNKVTLKFRPFNYDAVNIQVNYSLKNNTDPENIINKSSAFNIVNGRYTSYSFDVYDGWNELIITSNNHNIKKYYYGKKLQASISWYNENKLGDKFSNISKSDWINKSYFRFTTNLSENLKNIQQYIDAKLTGYIGFTKSTEMTTTNYDLWGTNMVNSSQLFDNSNTNDLHIAIGFQYSFSNDINDPILTIKNSANNKLLTLYQNKIEFDTFTDSGQHVDIYLPKTSNYAGQNKDEYHLLDIYVKRLDPIIIPTPNINNPEKMDDIEYDIWKLKNSTSSGRQEPDLFCVKVYIDGITENVLNTFVGTFPFPKTVCFYNVNTFYNLIEFAQINNADLHFTDVDAVMYWYSYKLQMTENKGIPEKHTALITSLASVEAKTADAPVETKSLSIKHNMLKIDENYLKQISVNSDIPIYIFNVRHLNVNDPSQTVFLWINKQYNEKDDIISWPIASSTNEDGSEHYTGISYIAPGTNNEVAVKFPKDKTTANTWDQAQFKLDLQGSSTRGNHAKNLDLGIIQQEDKLNTKFLFSPNYIDGDPNTYLPEEKFTLKADIVDSGHSNNTVMGKFINDNTTKFETYQKGKHVSYIKNCLTGYPCIVVLNVDYEVSGTQNEYYYLGIYNFNLGRGSYSNLGYRNISVFDDALTSVSDDSPFIFFQAEPETLQLNENFGAAEISGNSPKFDFSQWHNSILFQMENEPNGNLYMFDDIVTRSLGSFQSALQLFVKDVALSGGYIFKYLGKKFMDHDEWDLTPWSVEHTVPDPLIQYRRTPDNSFNSFVKDSIIDPNTGDDNWIYIFEKTIHDTEIDSATYRTRLDYTSALEYYVICMAFGLVDSVQKNLNIKTWTLNNGNFKDPITGESRAKFYTAFYDMDTCLGIDNDSADTSPYCFSDFWLSEEIGSDNNYLLKDTKVLRDYYNTEVAGESGYDIPSSSLFAIVKYGTSVYKKAFPEKDLEQADFPTPTDLWARYRLTDKKIYNLPGTACLSNVDNFMKNYYKKHLSGASEIIFNLNYNAKYFIYNYLEDWKIPDDIKSSIGVYTMQDGITSYDVQFHQDINKFRGRSINRIYDWLNARIHILDAYFNLTNAADFISVSNTDNAVTLLPLPDKLLNNIQENNDIHTFDQIFNNGAGRTKINMYGAVTLQMRALQYTPIMFMVGGTIQSRYLLKKPTNTYTCTINGSGSIDVCLCGSQSLTYLSNITWVTPKTLTITSNYLTNINGNNPITGVQITNIYCPSIQEIKLIGKNYTGTLNINSKGSKVDKYANLQIIDLSNSKISLSVDTEPVQYINVSNINTTSVSVRNCNKLFKPNNNTEAVNLNNATFTASLSLDINWTKNILLNNFETPELNINCTYAEPGNNIIVIDGKRNLKFSKLDKVSIRGYKNIYICNCPVLQTVVINDPENVTKLIVGNCCTNNGLSFKLNSSTARHIDLSNFNQLNEICFSQTDNFESIILPQSVILRGGDFSYCTALKYVNVVNDGSITFNGNGKRHSYVDLNNYTILDTLTDGVFYNCYNLTLERSATNNNMIRINIGENVTSLANMFALHDTSNNISFEKIIAFIDNIPLDNNITDISYMFANQSAFNLSKELYVRDTKANKSTLKLGIFHKVSNARGAFLSKNTDGSIRAYINKLVWYESNQKNQVFGGDPSVKTLDITYLFSSKDGWCSLYAPIDIYYPILSKITSLMGGGDRYVTYNPIYTNSIQTFNVATILTAYKKQEEQWSDKDYYTKTYTYSGTCGELIKTEVSLRNVFIDETNTNMSSLNIDTEDNLDAKFLSNIKTLSCFSLGTDVNNYTNAIWNFYGCFSKKWNITALDRFIGGNIKATDFEDMLANEFMPTNIGSIQYALNMNFYDNLTSEPLVPAIVDIERFFDFDLYMDNMVKYSNRTLHMFYGAFTLNKKISSKTFRKWLIKVLNLKNDLVPYIYNVFLNTRLIVTKEEADNECDFRLSTIFQQEGETIQQNTVIKHLDGVFSGLHCYKEGDDYRKSNNILYMKFGYDIFNMCPELTNVSNLFNDCYLFDPIPFNVFNKRTKKQKYYYLEDEESTRHYVKYISYEYKHEIESVSRCFCNVHYCCKYKQNNRFNPLNDRGENIILNAGVNRIVYQKQQIVEGTKGTENERYIWVDDPDKEPIIIMNNMILYNGPTGSSNTTVYPSTEYLDTLNLCGEFYTGIFSNANNGTVVANSYQQKLPLVQDANMNGGAEPYKTSLIVPPDLLYGCTTNCSCYKVVSTTYNNDKLIGIIPKHLLRYISSSSNDYNSQSLNLFEGCIIIPNYVGTYVTYNEREVLENEDTSTYKTERYIQKTYNVYTFIPEGFIQNKSLTSLYGLCTFHIHWPKQSYKVNDERVDYDFYVMSTTNSFHNNITNINFNSYRYNYNYNYNYDYDYNSQNRGIHFNLQCTYNIDDKVYTSEEKKNIFGDLYSKYPNICKVFNGFSTGINLNIFTTLQVNNLITSLYILSGYFGNIFEGSTVENLKILSGYCINIANGNANSISCNAIFPPMNRNIRNFITSNTKYNLYNSQIEDNNITYYDTVYHDILDFRGDSAVRPQYLDIE